MLKRTFKYTDFNGDEREEEVFFHLTRSEAVELSMAYPGGLAKYVQRTSDDRNGAAMVKFVQDIILKAYGEKSDDGRRFIKSKERAEAFKDTPMFDQLFMEISFDDRKMQEFIEGITPTEAANPERGAISNFTPGPLPTENNVVQAPVMPMS